MFFSAGGQSAPIYKIWVIIYPFWDYLWNFRFIEILHTYLVPGIVVRQIDSFALRAVNAVGHYSLLQSISSFISPQEIYMYTQWAYTVGAGCGF